VSTLLAVDGLVARFRTDRGWVRAVDGVSFTVGRGRTVGVVGESGCGKSVTALSIMGLLPRPPAEIAAGRILFEGEDLLALPLSRLQDIRGDRIAMVFQEPMSSLNPAFTIGRQIAETLVRHRGLTEREARAEATQMLRRVHIPAAESRVDEYPHKLSGGMRQRVMIALALACDPDLLIADEPTTALDVTIQAQILDLLRELRAATGMAILLITHDLGVVAEMADDVLVMYAGRVVERAPVRALFATPQHPYTIGLMGSVPRPDETRTRLAAIEGQVPNPLALPPGCAFHPRCPFAVARCRVEAPPLAPVGEALGANEAAGEDGHWAACWRAPLTAEMAA